MKSVPWVAGFFFLFGMVAYLFFSWFMPLSPFSDYRNLVTAAAVVGGVVGKVFESRLAAPKTKTPPTEGEK